MKQRRKELSKYRQIHHISDADHAKALARWGWTIEEFEAGKVVPVHVQKQKQHPNHDNDDNNCKHDEAKHQLDRLFLDQKDWKWVLYDLYKRLFG